MTDALAVSRAGCCGRTAVAAGLQSAIHYVTGYNLIDIATVTYSSRLPRKAASDDPYS